jgi:A/G-specific adenine glycosylase
MLKWYRKHGRDLPWRNTHDPYKILVSEVMLQQTQVDRVQVYYKTWLKTFPNWKQLAQASNADVIHAWAGLGYNRRALALRDIAKQVIERGVPTNREEWLQLKGIGPYTSGALAAFALKQRELPIDTNIRRVLGRFYFGTPFPDLKDDKKIDELADHILPKRGHYYDVPQAIFDLATMICTKMPDCASCPLKNECKAAEAFLSGSITPPKRTVKKANERKHRDKRYPDRIYRGRILKIVREQGSVEQNKVGPQIDPHYDQIADEEWVHNMIARLEKDGLLKKSGKRLSL